MPGGVNVPCLAVVIPTLNEQANVPLLARRLTEVLAGHSWEAIFVDDDSSDPTMEAIRALSCSDPRIRGIRRIGRRGLSGAAIEGILSTSAEFVAVMDADLQHDETRLVDMLALLREGEADVVVGSRYLEGGEAKLGLSRQRRIVSRLAIRIARFIYKDFLSDPMSGFFMCRREIVDEIARDLSPKGYKILLDVLTSSPRRLSVREIAIAFSPRLHGESKLDSKVVLDYLDFILSKLSAGRISARFLMFGLVGGSGLIVHLSLLWALLSQQIGFAIAQAVATLAAMTSNYFANNALTYHDRRRRGWHILTGLMSFVAVCSIGMIIAVALSTQLYSAGAEWWIAGIAGALIAAIWNFATTAAFTWHE